MSKSDRDSDDAPHVDNAVDERKRVALKFLQLIVAGQIDEAHERYVLPHAKHHNPLFAAGFPALREAMKENHAQFPNKRFTVKNALGDGDLVAIHSHIVARPGEAGYIAVHLLRFNNKKIAEMWDCIEAIPEDSPNKDGAF